MFLDMKKISKISCEKLQDFFVIDQQIENLKNQLEFEYSNNKDVNSFIKSKNKRGNDVKVYKRTYKPKYDYIIENNVEKKLYIEI